MTVDRYTKTLLTIIAVCLLLQTMLALDRIVEARQSPYQEPGMVSNVPQRVIIAGWESAAIASAPPVPVTLTHPIKLADTPLPVSIDAIRKTNYPWNAITVHLEERKSLPE